MGQDAKDAGEKGYEDFKNLVFATSRGPADPNLYENLFGDEILSPEEEESLEWVVPETESDVQDVMKLLHEAGWSG